MSAMSVPKLLVVGGNGFLGSAICKAGVAKGWEVSSMSSSGKPYATPAGHTPKWVDRVSWHAASAFEPSSYSSLVSSSSAVVHTLGILLENANYKAAVQGGNVLSLLSAFAGGVGGSGNPLQTETEKRRGYDGMNRDAALKVFETFMEAQTPVAEGEAVPTKPFVYISAADAFRPVVPSRYIESKREAEFGILRKSADRPELGIRPLFMRPGLMYHPHIRPVSTLPAFLLSCTASLPFGNPFASKSLLGGAVESLSTHPLHVDHVASAVIRSIEDEQVRGVVDIDTMRKWAGFDVKGRPIQANAMS